MGFRGVWLGLYGLHTARLEYGYASPMARTTDTDIGGKVIAPAHDEPFTLAPEDEDELLAAMAEIERGEFVTGDALLENLRKYG